MIDEPFALLAEAFGQDLEHLILPPVGEAPDASPDLVLIAAAVIDPVEMTTRAH